ncbi:MAG: DUF177 domain-containing protein [Pseudomonadota bacterium]|nr:DUF177 domain-containing protein [Pseudomonadota bacterium]
MSGEVDRSLSLDRIGPDGLDVHVEAGEDECAALARRMMIAAIVSLGCRFRLHLAPADAVSARGRLTARLVQTCVVTLDDFEAEIDEEFAIRFVPSGTETDDPDPEAEDEVPYHGGTIDLGEAAAEQFALALDPYPRKLGAELPEETANDPERPFSRLNELRRPH